MGNALDINLTNFQSIGSAKLTFEPGITLLVGQSNSGKSATLRAIKAVLNNPSRAKTFIKHGKGNTNVEITFDGNNISWSRSDKESAYSINGQDYTKVGNRSLFDLLPDNGFVRDDDDNVMNIEGELELPFPFDRTPSQLFKLFENIFCVSDSALIIKTFKDDEARFIKEKNGMEDRLVRLNTKKQALGDLKAEVNLDEIKQALNNFRDDYDSYVEISEDTGALIRCEEVSKLTFNEVTPPEEYSLDSYIELRKDLNFLFNGVLARQKFYKGLEPPLETPSTLDEYLELKTDLNILSKASELDNLDVNMAPPMKTTTLDDYLTLRQDMVDIMDGAKASEFEIADNPKLTSSLEEYLEMVDDLKFVTNCFNMCKSKKQRYEELEEKIVKIQSRLGEYKVCPLCGHALEEGE